jgi:hypothetical protein
MAARRHPAILPGRGGMWRLAGGPARRHSQAGVHISSPTVDVERGKEGFLKTTATVLVLTQNLGVLL